jgi:hypothetical protein
MSRAQPHLVVLLCAIALPRAGSTQQSFRVEEATIAVPMGFVRETLPVGLQFFGDAWSEPTLIRLAYAYEQATQHRRPPSSTPPLPPAPER